MNKLNLLITGVLLLNMAPEVQAQAPNLPNVPAGTTMITRTYVAFPETTNCNVEYYGTEANSYVYHGGYFWYPNADGTLLDGYEPTYWDGQYWYPSRIHPHHVYVEKQNVLYILPEEPKGFLE